MHQKNNNRINGLKSFVKQVLNKLPYISRLSRQIKELGAFPAGHYHSPIPASQNVDDAIVNRPKNKHLFGIDLRAESQLSLLDEFVDYYPEIPFLSKSSQTHNMFHLDQDWFGYTDAIMLYCMIRKFRFKKVVEVGSGFSSAVMLEAYHALQNDDFHLTMIDPFPGRLRSLVDIKANPNVELIEAPVEETDINVFTDLGAGDLLFIDSSHVVKFQSDLYHLLFRVIPLLKPGVVVHFHDIFYPFEYPDHWLLEGRYWNECYFLQAFLTDNEQWEILLFNHYLNDVHAEVMRDKMPLCRRNLGGSLYIRKRQTGNLQ